jgi:hypothetical protein
MRLLSTAIAALCIALVGAKGARADQCRAIDAAIVTTFTMCAPGESPLGICTEGKIDSGLLQGTTRFAVQTMTGSADGVLYTGVLTITTRSGTVTIDDFGVLNPTTGEFFELEQVVSGTGRFKHMTGTLTSQGVQTMSGFAGTLTGTLCHFNEGRSDR